VELDDSWGEKGYSIIWRKDEYAQLTPFRRFGVDTTIRYGAETAK
jgi:hypothetical protein